MHSTWQESLKQLITDPCELFDLLQLDLSLLAEAKRVVQVFPLRVPRAFINKIEVGNINDPLLKQILPLGIELKPIRGFTNDSINEKKVNVIPGLLHKYQNRVLITMTNACAVHCRYCFRRAFPYDKNKLSHENWQRILNYISSDFAICEIIYSGGDPLVMTDMYLKKWTEQLAKIPHLKTLRIHSRLPIVLPERVTSDLVNFLTVTSLRPIVVVHCNHANEIDEHVHQAIVQLRDAKITVLNQSVLLRGVNDKVSTLVKLSETLWEIGVLPYYLHCLDKVHGVAHFNVTEKVAKELLSGMQKHLPGYLVPKLVKDIAGAHTKQWITS